MKRRLLLFWLVLSLTLLAAHPLRATVQNPQLLPVDKAQNFTVTSATPIEILVKFSQIENETAALRLHTTGYSNVSLLLVARQQQILHTWSLPYTFVDVNNIGDESPVETFQSLSRTLCPPQLWPQIPDQQQQVFLRVTTDSATPVSLTARAQIDSHFRLSLGETVQLLLRPSSPQLLFFDFDSKHPNTTDLRAVRILVESNDSACSLVSVQRSRCPVQQMPPTVLQRGFRQTLLSSSVIFMRRDEFSRFLVVLLAFPDNRNCLASWEQDRRQRFASKSVTIKVEQIPMHDLVQCSLLLLSAMLTGVDCAVAMIAIVCLCNCQEMCNLLLLPLLAFLCAFAILLAVFLLLWFSLLNKGIIVFLVCILVCIFVLSIVCVTFHGKFDQRSTDQNETSSSVQASGSHVQASGSHVQASGSHVQASGSHVQASGSHVQASGSHVQASGSQARQDENQHVSHAMQLSAIAIFYCLPVVQLVLMQQESMDSGGNLDECYYNYKCRFYVKTSLTSFYSFNNVVSNAGYVAAGIVFMVTVLWKEKFMDTNVHMGPERQLTTSVDSSDVSSSESTPLNNRADQPPGESETVNIPCCYSAHYAAGLALAMEGVLSACYHVCPSHNTFQFDTAFMLMLASMLYLAIYSKRHMNSGSLAKVTFVALGVTVLVNSFGILFSNISPMFVFVFLGVVLLGLSIVLGFAAYFKEEWHKRHEIILAVPINSASGIASLVIGIGEFRVLFANLVLGVLLANSAAYFLYYCCRKFITFPNENHETRNTNECTWCCECCNREFKYSRSNNLRGAVVTILFVSFIVLLIWAVINFWNAPTDWSRSPAESRKSNNNCHSRLFGFPFDQHDQWHLIGSQALFCLLLVVLFMDFDEERQKRKAERIF